MVYVSILERSRINAARIAQIATRTYTTRNVERQTFAAAAGAKIGTTASTILSAVAVSVVATTRSVTC